MDPLVPDNGSGPSTLTVSPSATARLTESLDNRRKGDRGERERERDQGISHRGRGSAIRQVQLISDRSRPVAEVWSASSPDVFFIVIEVAFYFVLWWLKLHPPDLHLS